MNRPIAVGTVRETTGKTRAGHTARHLYGNLPDVVAAPFLAGFMERVPADLINGHRGTGEQSAGIRTEVAAADGPTRTFRLEAWDETEKIGGATHERRIIPADTFRARVAKKKRAPA